MSTDHAIRQVTEIETRHKVNIDSHRTITGPEMSLQMTDMIEIVNDPPAGTEMVVIINDHPAETDMIHLVKITVMTQKTRQVFDHEETQ